MNEVPFSNQLIKWYQLHARDLPWRQALTPYEVWVSEIMLQQTRVGTVVPFYLRWMERFPDLETLAISELDEVLRNWEGLGYYARARNMHRTAQILMDDYDGTLPEDPDKLESLPGIGRYTAGAIASIAFGRDYPVVDGNIQRVLARYFNIELPVASPEGKRRFWQLAAEHLPPGQASTYNQALMELGALVCRPKAPECNECPLQQSCEACALGIQEERPVKSVKPARPHHIVTAAVIQNSGQFLITQRPAKGLLGGMWEFPEVKSNLAKIWIKACVVRSSKNSV